MSCFPLRAAELKCKSFPPRRPAVPPAPFPLPHRDPGVYDKAADGAPVRISRCRFENVGSHTLAGGMSHDPLIVYGSGFYHGNNRSFDVGGVVFDDVTVVDSLDRVFLRGDTPSPRIVRDVTGSVTDVNPHGCNMSFADSAKDIDIAVACSETSAGWSALAAQPEPPAPQHHWQLAAVQVALAANDSIAMLKSDDDENAFIVTAAVDPEPILAYTGVEVGPQNTAWQQNTAFNPTWVAPSPATGNRSGLLVRSQNCTPTKPGCVGCSGTGQRASWLTWAELANDGGPKPLPRVTNFVGVDEVVFGPFDCEAPGSKCIDAKGTEDPRLTFDPDTSTYYLLYNGPGGVFLALASTKNPTKRFSWTRHGRAKIFGEATQQNSGSIVWRESGNHFVIYECDGMLKIAPSIGRNLTTWNYSASTDLFGIRKEPCWDTIFVESAMPPLRLSTGDLPFDSMGWGFQPGWVVLSGADPRKVLGRASVPPMPHTLAREEGTKPWPCNTPGISNLGGGHPTSTKDQFRVYLGGADAVVGSALVSVEIVPKAPKFSCVPAANTTGVPASSLLAQCLPAATHSSSAPNETFASFDACQAACLPKPPPPPPPTPPPMQLGVLYNNTAIDGVRAGADGTAKTSEECNASCAKSTPCNAFVFDNRSSCPEGACCWHKGLPLKPTWAPGKLAMLVRLPPETPGWHGPIYGTYSDNQCPNVGCHSWKGINQSEVTRQLEALCDSKKGCTAFNLGGGGGCLRGCLPDRLIRYNVTGGGCCSFFRITGPPKLKSDDVVGTRRVSGTSNGGDSSGTVSSKDDVIAPKFRNQKVCDVTKYGARGDNKTDDVIPHLVL